MERPTKSGLTLVELIIGIALMAMIATALSALTEHVLQVSSNVERLNQSTQVNVVVQRQFESLVNKAIATADFPGVMYVEATNGQPGLAIRDVAKDSLPQQKEILFLTHDPNRVNEWCVFRSQRDSACPVATDAPAWSLFFADTIGDVSSERHVISNRIATTISNQPVVQWSNDLRPTASEIQNYRDGFISWEQLPWPQGKFTAERGSQRRQYSIMLLVLDSQGHAVPVYLNHSISSSIAK